MPKKKDTPADDIDVEVPSGRIFVTGDDADAIFEASSSAASSLSTATLSASAIGLDNVATATEALQITINHHFHFQGPITINQDHSLTVIDQSITTIEQQIKDVTEALTATGIPFFECTEAYENCMARASDKAARHRCRLSYIGCLGTQVTPWIRALLGLT